MTADPQPVPDAALTAALGGYYGHPTAITAADPDIVDGLTAGLAAGLAEARKDERAKVAEDLRARIVGRLKWACEHFQDDPECAELTAAGLEEFFQVDLAAKDTEIAEQTLLAINAENARAYQQRRAEQAEAELEQWRACFGETALKDARGVLAERDQLRAAAERVREILDYFDGQIIALESGNPAVGSAFRFTFTKIRAAIERAFGPFHGDDTDPYAPDVVRWLRGQCINCGRGPDDEPCGVAHMFRAAGTS